MNNREIGEALEICLDTPFVVKERWTIEKLEELAEALKPLLANVFSEGWKAGWGDRDRGRVTTRNPYRWDDT